MCIGRLLVAFAALTLASGACASHGTATPTPTPTFTFEPPGALTFVADFVIPFEGRATGLEFGGLSGLAFDGGSGTWVGVSDDRQSPRWFTLRVGFSPTGMVVDAGSPVLAETARVNAAVPPVLDLESVGLLPNGDLLMGSEGDVVAGRRQPHSIVRFTRDGRFVSEVPLPDHYRGDPEGAPPRGLRDNLGFEGLAMAPDGSRAWLAAENPLAQDDERPTRERGARTRLLEVVSEGGAFVPRREFVYEIDPAGHPAGLATDAVLVDQGVVALLWLGEARLLSMERAFVRDASAAANVVRIYDVRLDGADDVSGVASLRDRTSARAVTKALLLDLDDIAGSLRPSLARLDNFEVMAWGPILLDGTRTILIASDDNFSARQQNAFVLLAVNRVPKVPPKCPSHQCLSAEH